MNALCDFARTGVLGFLKLGLPYPEVIGRLGEPEGTSTADQHFFLYGDLQLGFTSTGRLWHVAVEPADETAHLPGALLEVDVVDVPTVAEIQGSLVQQDGALRKIEPFAAGEFWFHVTTSGVLIHEDERSGLVDAIHLSRPDLLDPRTTEPD